MSPWGPLSFVQDLLLPEERLAIDAVSMIYPVKVTSEYARLINWENPDDPLRKQVIPSLHELKVEPYESRDPLNEQQYFRAPGLIHKYAGRVLWLVTEQCPVHCRFCFRRWHHWQGHSQTNYSKADLDTVVQYLENNPDLFEIILSGGDPLCLDRDVLNHYLERLNLIPTIRSIRIHTRFPVVACETESSRAPLFSGNSTVTRIVLHINHPNEVSKGLIDYLRMTMNQSISVLSQTVLLAGINDSEETLFELFRKLIEYRVQPYYIHILDPAEGTHHFRVPESNARFLMEKIRVRLPGFAIPRLVRDIPGRGAKTFI